MNPSVDLSALPLRDIHLPDPVPWWPPAPGWWLLAALALLGAIAFGLHYYRYRSRRSALRALGRARAALDRGADPVGCLQEVSTVLRRFAMTCAEARRGEDVTDFRCVAGLIGERWLAYLDSRWPRDAFRNGAGRLLLAAPYARPHTVAPGQALDLIAITTAWIRAQKLARRSIFAMIEPPRA
jgi:hypothetical protein